jgi:pimeloyl-ACP methyl ester carboxylesterase
MFRFLAIIFAGMVLFGGSVSSQNSSNKLKEGDLRFKPFNANIGGVKVEGKLGSLVVRENRRKKSSNLIELAFLIVKSTAKKPGYPVIYLAGGPGSSGINAGRNPAYLKAFMKMREVGDVILLDQRGVGRSKPALVRPSSQPLPTDAFANKERFRSEFQKQVRQGADYFRNQGIEINAYNTVESAHDIDDLRKALGAEKVNLVGFSYGTHLGLASIRYHGKNLNRVVLIGTEGPNHTEKLPFTSDQSLRRLAGIVAKDPVVGKKVPDLVGSLKRVLTRFEKEPVTVTVINWRTRKPVDIKIGKFGLQMIIRIDLGDSNDLPLFPAWFHTMDKGDYSILKTFAEKRYNLFGRGVSIMSLMMDTSSGATNDRRRQIKRESKTALLGDMVNFFDARTALGNPDLGDEYRSPIKTKVPTMFISGTFDNNTPPSQADEVRKNFKTSSHIVVENAGHESMLVNSKVQQSLVDFLNGKDVSKVKIALPQLKFKPIPD